MTEIPSLSNFYDSARRGGEIAVVQADALLEKNPNAHAEAHYAVRRIDGHH